MSSSTSPLTKNAPKGLNGSTPHVLFVHPVLRVWLVQVMQAVPLACLHAFVSPTSERVVR